MNQVKYKTVKIRLKEMKGVSTGIVPNHVNRRKVTAKYQKKTVFFSFSVF